MRANNASGHAKRLHYVLECLTGVDAHGSPCYSYVLFPPEVAARRGADGVLRVGESEGVVLHSGWGEPDAYDDMRAQSQLAALLAA